MEPLFDIWTKHFTSTTTKIIHKNLTNNKLSWAELDLKKTVKNESDDSSTSSWIEWHSLPLVVKFFTYLFILILTWWSFIYVYHWCPPKNFKKKQENQIKIIKAKSKNQKNECYSQAGTMNLLLFMYSLMYITTFHLYIYHWECTVATTLLLYHFPHVLFCEMSYCQLILVNNTTWRL